MFLLLANSLADIIVLCASVCLCIYTNKEDDRLHMKFMTKETGLTGVFHIIHQKFD